MSTICKKVLMIGDPKSGESELCEALKKFNNLRTKTTDNCIVNLNIIIATNDGDDRKTCITHHLDADVILLCFDIATPGSFNNIRVKWINKIKKHLPSTPFILVGLGVYLRKSEIENLWRRPVSWTDGRELAEKIGAEIYLECCVSRRYGIKTIFKETAKAALRERRVEKERQCILM